jgi:hypothetical protein
MASGTRTLKLSILADVAGLSKGLDQGSNEVQSFGSKVTDFGKKAGLAFAVAGAAAAAYAGKLLVDGVKSAIADEAAQAKLATTLQNVAGATNSQVKAVEDYIYQTEIANNVTDDVLRPSLERLLRATSNITEAQKLQGLALDIAAGSGKSLEAVSNALGKAYEGNTGALGKLGVGISAAELKTMSFDQITTALASTFEGQAAVAADTFSGKLGRLGLVFNEAKETVGSFVIDAITPMVTLFLEKVVPVINTLAQDIGEKLTPVFANLATFFTEVLIPIFSTWWSFLTDVVIPGVINFLTPVLDGLKSAFSSISSTIKDNKENLTPLFELFKAVASFVAKYLAPVIGTILGTAFNVLGKAISGIITLFANLVGLINDAVGAVKALARAMADSVVGKAVGAIAGGISNVFGGGRAAGGSVMSGTSYLVGEKGPEIFTPSSSGTITPNGALGGSTYNITVNGALDGEGVARQIVDILNRSQARGTQGASNLAFTGV